MTVAERPLAIIPGRHRASGDGVHLVAVHYQKGTRLEPHLHREAQLVYAARGTMQVTTPKGRWLVPPDRAVWVPARFEHAIDVLADIEMRTLYFDAAWLKRERHGASLASEFVVRVSPLLHQAILALFDDGKSRERMALLIKLVMLELDRAGGASATSSRCRRRRAAAAPPTSCCAPAAAHEIRRPCPKSWHLGANLVAAVFGGDPTQLQELVPARAHCVGHRAAVDAAQRLGETDRRRPRLCQYPRLFPCLPAGDGQDADGICGNQAGRLIATKFALNPMVNSAPSGIH